MLKSHFFHMLIFTILISGFFAFLTKNDLKGRLKVGILLAMIMIVASLFVSYLLYPFPR